MRYKPEGKFARAWKKIALNVEKHNGQYDGYNGLCAAIDKCTLSDKNRITLFCHFNEVFGRAEDECRNPFWWYRPESAFRNYDVPSAEGRTLAAWFMYWLCRENGL